MLGDGGQNVDGEARVVRIIAADEIDLGLHQVRHEGEVAREAVELGNQQDRTGSAAGCQRLGEPPVALAWWATALPRGGNPA